MKRLFVLLLLCLLLVGCTALRVEQGPAPLSGELEVHYLDVGQADCILLQCGGASMLIDGGNVDDGQLVVSYLEQQGVERLESVVCTHAHEDHVGGLPGVLAVFETGNVWCPVREYSSKCFRDFLYYADQQDLELVCPAPGSTYDLGGAEVTVLGPVRDDYDTNNSSIVLRVEYGQTSFLFTGDAETQAENDILDAGYDVSATVLKVGHHGSETSTGYRWLRTVDPAYAVIQVGTGNSYGHPHEAAMSRLRDAQVPVYRTDMQGHTVCRSDGQSVSFTTQKEAAETNPTAAPQQFIGNVNSKKFHLPSCSGLPEEKNQVVFESYAAAQEAGYAPCSRCMP